MTDRYETPLSSRYASEYMLNLFSADTRYQTWRKLWTALAREEMKLGLPITESQVAELTGWDRNQATEAIGSVIADEYDDYQPMPEEEDE